MALSKKIQHPNGTETNYHKVHEVTLIHESDIIGTDVVDTGYEFAIKVYSYVSQELRAVSEHNYVKSTTVYGNKPADMVEGTNVMSVAYQIVLEDPRFAGAEPI